MKRILVSIITVTVFLTSVAYWLLMTNSGLSVVLKTVNKVIPGNIEAESVHKEGFNKLVLINVRYNDELQIINLGRLQAELDFSSFLSGRISVTTLDVNNLEYFDKNVTNKSDDPEDFSLPFALDASQVSINNIIVSSGDQQEPFRIDALSMSEFVGQKNTFFFKGAELQLEDMHFLLNGSIALNKEEIDINTDAYFVLSFNQISNVVGSGTISGNMSELKAKASLHQPFKAEVIGDIQFTDPHLKWQIILKSDLVDITEINKEWPLIALGNARVRAAGNDINTIVRLSSQSAWVNNEIDAAIDAAIRIDNDQIELTKLLLTKNNAILSATGKMSFKGAEPWEADITVSQLNPGEWFADWPGNLNAEGRISGHQKDTKSSLFFELKELSGQLKGYPIFGKGQAQYSDTLLQLDDVFIESEAGTLNASGKCNKECDVAFALNVGDLGKLLTSSSGILDIEGQVTGAIDQAQVDVRAVGSDFSYDDVSVGDITGTGSFRLSDKGEIKTELTAQAVQYQEYQFAEGLFSLSGTIASLKTSLSLRGDGRNIQIDVNGGKHGESFSAAIERLDFAFEQFGMWGLQHPVTFEVSKQHLLFNNLCLVEQDSGLFCVNGEYQTSGAWFAKGNGSKLPISALHSFLPPDSIKLTGHIQTAFSLNGDNTSILTGDLALSTENVVLSSVNNDDKMADANINGAAHINYADKTLKGDIKLQSPQWGDATTELVVDDLELLSWNATSLLSGNIVMNINDISFLNAWLKDVAVLQGRIDGDFAVNGSLQSPYLVGKMQLLDGSAKIVETGITIHPLLVEIEGDQNHLVIALKGSSGDGEIDIRGIIIPRKGLGQDLVFTIKGSDFLFLQSPGMTVSVSPELMLKISEYKNELSGKVIIDEAEITKITGDNFIAPSSDVIIIQEGDNSINHSRPFYADVELVIKDSINVDMYGLRGQVAGKLRVIDLPGSVATGDGTLRLENATFGIYGRQMNIDVGRLIFAGGILTNPGLEMRSERRIEGVVVGMEVTGFIQRPVFNLYSSPYREQYFILSSLLGNDSMKQPQDSSSSIISAIAEKIGFSSQEEPSLFNFDTVKLEFGDKLDSLSLIIGTWLTPSFYVSYGRSLVNESSTFISKLSLGHGFYLKTETGATQSGGDIKYEFEH